MSQAYVWVMIPLILSVGLQLGCQRAGHSYSDVSAEHILLRASGACLAKIVRLDEHDDRPADGDHWIEAWLEIEEASGEVPETLYLVVEPGGLVPPEYQSQREKNQRTMILRHDSLKVGERYWFVFSRDDDPAKYPPGVAGWWPDEEGEVPYDVVEAIQHGRFADHPMWDKERNVVTTWWQNGDQITIHVREADSLKPSDVLFAKTISGELQSLNLAHAAIGYEMESSPGKQACYVQVDTIGKLAEDNEFDLPPGDYRMRFAFDLDTGKLAARWIAKNQESWLLQAFRQYDLESGQPTTAMDFDLLDSGGIEAGGDSLQWYRRVIKKYQDGQLQSEKTFRHLHIKTGREPVDSRLYWTPVAS